MRENSSFKKILKFSSILIGGNIIISVLAVIVTSILTKNISIYSYGIIVMVQAYTMFIDQLFNFQSWQGLIKFGSIALENKNKQDFIKYLHISVFLDIIGSLLSFIFSFILLNFLSNVFNKLDLLFSYSFYFFIFLFRIIGTPTGVIRLRNEYKYFNYQLIINWSVKILLLLILLNFHLFKISYILLVFLIGEILSSIYLIYIGVRSLKFYNISLKEIIPYNIKKLLNNIFLSKRFLIFSLRTNLNGAILGSIRTIDELLIASLLGPASAGIFKIMKLTTSIISKILNPLYISIYPEINMLLAKFKLKEVKNLIHKISLLNFFISILLIGIFFLIGDKIIVVLFSPEYLKGLTQIQFYLIGILISFIFFYAQPLMLALDLEGKSLLINFIASIVYIISLYFFTKNYALWGVVISFLIFNVLVIFPKIYFINKKISIFKFEKD